MEGLPVVIKWCVVIVIIELFLYIWEIWGHLHIWMPKNLYVIGMFYMRLVYF